MMLISCLLTLIPVRQRWFCFPVVLPACSLSSCKICSVFRCVTEGKGQRNSFSDTFELDGTGTSSYLYIASWTELAAVLPDYRSILAWIVHCLYVCK